MNWYHVESATEPEEQDTTSSKKYNYVRQNIEEVEKEIDGETITVYEYDECKIPKTEWGVYEATTQNTADIEYIALMADIDLED